MSSGSLSKTRVIITACRLPFSFLRRNVPLNACADISSPILNNSLAGKAAQPGNQSRDDSGCRFAPSKLRISCRCVDFNVPASVMPSDEWVPPIGAVSQVDCVELNNRSAGNDKDLQAAAVLRLDAFDAVDTSDPAACEAVSCWG